MKSFLLCYFVVIAGLVVFFKQDPRLEESIERGKEIYTDFCITCHLEAGEGVAGAFPPLAKSDYLIKNRALSIRGVKFGQQGEIQVNGQTYNSVMAPMGLEDEEIADVMNYVLNSFGNSSETMVTPEEVAAIKQN